MIKVSKQNKIGTSFNLRSQLASVTSAESRFSPSGIFEFEYHFVFGNINNNNKKKSTKANCFHWNSKTLNCIDSTVLESRRKRILLNACTSGSYSQRSPRPRLPSVKDYRFRLCPRATYKGFVWFIFSRKRMKIGVKAMQCAYIKLEYWAQRDFWYTLVFRPKINK